MDGVSNSICKIADSAELIRNVSRDKAWLEEAHNAVNIAQSFLNRINIDKKMYEILEVAIKDPRIDALAHPEYEVLRSMFECMQNEGVHLSDEMKEQCHELSDLEAALSYEFSRGSLGSDASASFSKEDSIFIPLSAMAPVTADNSDSAQMFQKMFSKSQQSINGEMTFAIPLSHAYIPHLATMSPSAEVRSRVSQAWRSSQGSRRADMTLSNLVRVRHQIARTRGFNSWAEHKMREGILSTPKEASEFLDLFVKSIIPGASKELSILFEFSRKNKIIPENSTGLLQTDLTAALAAYNGQKRRTDSTELALLESKLSIRKIVTAYSRVLEKLFGVKVISSPSNESWHWSVIKLDIFPAAASSPEEEENFKKSPAIGCMFLDLFAAANKSDIHAQFTLRGSKCLTEGLDKFGWNLGGQQFARDGVIRCGSVDLPANAAIPESSQPIIGWEYGSIFQTPMTALVTSFHPRSPEVSEILMAGNGFAARSSRNKKLKSLTDDEKLSLILDDVSLSLHEAKTLFHELGHCAHHLLSRTKSQHLSGTRGPTDFVEFPSHLFEFIIKDPEVFVDLFSCGEDVASSDDIEMIHRMIKTHHTPFANLESLKHAIYAAVDQVIFSQDFAQAIEAGVVGSDPSTPDLISLIKKFIPSVVPSLSSKIDGSDETLWELLAPSTLDGFTHLAHYAGTYYCYPYSFATSALSWKSLKETAAENGGFTTDSGARSMGKRIEALLSLGSGNATLASLSRHVLSPSDLEIKDNKMSIGEKDLKTVADSFRQSYPHSD